MPTLIPDSVSGTLALAKRSSCSHLRPTEANPRRNPRRSPFRAKPYRAKELFDDVDDLMRKSDARETGLAGGGAERPPDR